ncbi:MAG: hypothetical protein AAF433_21760 [Bacteroidota bacterium]
MKLLKSEEQEVRLVGENNYRRLLATYAIIVIMVIGLAIQLIWTNRTLLPHLIFAVVVIIKLIRRYTFIPARDPNYMREELHFRKGRIWNKISVGNPDNGELEPRYPLSVYIKDRHYRIFEARQNIPLFEFELDYSDRDPQLMDKIANSLEVEGDFRLHYEHAEKYLLHLAGQPVPQAFTPWSTTVQGVYKSPNDFFQLLVDPNGIVDYSWNSKNVINSPGLRLLSAQQEIKHRLNRRKPKSLPFGNARSFQGSHYLREEKVDNAISLVLSVYLHLDGRVTEIAKKSYVKVGDGRKQRLDLVEDVQVFQRDLLARLREVSFGTVYQAAPERVEILSSPELISKSTNS